MGAQSSAALTIIDDPTVPSNSQPIDDPTTFVCQHHYDFLGREPDTGGLAYWTEAVAKALRERLV